MVTDRMRNGKRTLKGRASVGLCISLVFLFLVAVEISHAKILYVDSDRPSSGTGASWTEAFQTIQEAVDAAASSGDSIWVRQGTHELFSPIAITKAVHLFGGFAGTEAGPHDRDWRTNASVVDGQGSVACLDMDADVVLDGFTITNGRRGVTIASAPSDPSFPIIRNCTFTNNEADEGGAISTLFTYLSLTGCSFENNQAKYRGGAIYNEVADISVTGCSFSNNRSLETGGAIYNDGSWGTTRCYVVDSAFSSNTAGWQGGAIHNSAAVGSVNNSIFTGNTAESANGGGAMYNSGAIFDIDSCIFSSNSTGWGGGAINNSEPNSIIKNSPTTIRNCTFIQNHADYVGGAIWNWQGKAELSPRIINCVFFRNSTDGPGGAIANSWSAPIITHCTFVENTSVEKGGGINNSGRTYLNESPKITNSILWDDSAPVNPEIANSNCYPSVTYSDVKGGYSGTGNKNLDPKLTVDLHLSAGSPCIDTGSNSAPELPATDKDGKLRMFDGDGNGTAKPDMGAYEYGSTLPSDFDKDGDVDGQDLAELAVGFGEEFDETDLASFALIFGR